MLKIINITYGLWILIFFMRLKNFNFNIKSNEIRDIYFSNTLVLSSTSIEFRQLGVENNFFLKTF